MKTANEVYEYITTNISKEDFCSYCDTHIKNEIMEHFEIPYDRTYRRITKFFGYDTHRRNPNKGKKSTCTHEEYLERGKKSGKTQRDNWESKTQEERDAWSMKQSIAHLSSPTFKDKITESNRNYRYSLTQEEKDRQDNMRSESMRSWWNSLSDEERTIEINKHFNNGAGYKTSNSKPNLDFIDILNANDIIYTREHRIGKYSYDFKVGDTLIEINPSATHNSTWSPFGNPTDKYYHRNKSICANENDFSCIHIFDWDDKKKVVSMLKDRDTVYARECVVKEVPKNDAKDFINTYHLQNYARDCVRLGLYYKCELISVMTFGSPRYNKNYKWELVRYCSSKNVIGGAERLFTNFLKEYGGSIISYCDLSKFSGVTYTKLGFKQIRSGKPSIHWYNIKTRVHITDNLLRQRGFDQLFGTNYGKGVDNRQLMIDNGFVEIYDCGQKTFVYER